VTYRQDLSTRVLVWRGERVRAIGWLEGNHSYRRGAVPASFVDRLKQHVRSAYQPVKIWGWHDCTLCPRDGAARGASNVMIPTPELLYIAPGMVVHYIEDHDYHPPEEFIEAVLACPTKSRRSS
jgi:hypothetical protein